MCGDERLLRFGVNHLGDGGVMDCLYVHGIHARDNQLFAEGGPFGTKVDVLAAAIAPQEGRVRLVRGVRGRHALSNSYDEVDQRFTAEGGWLTPKRAGRVVTPMGTAQLRL